MDGAGADAAQTPFYLFDTDAAAAQVEALRKKLPDRVGLCYAVKANPFLIRDLEPVVDHFEVCSPGSSGFVSGWAFPWVRW